MRVKDGENEGRLSKSPLELAYPGPLKKKKAGVSESMINGSAALPLLMLSHASLVAQW